MQLGYFAWFAVYVLLGGLSVALPALAAIDIWNRGVGQMLAGGGALTSAVFAFLKPHEYATGYDNATQSVWKTLVSSDLLTQGSTKISGFGADQGAVAPSAAVLRSTGGPVISVVEVGYVGRSEVTNLVKLTQRP
jgi:hypothetical protein